MQSKRITGVLIAVMIVFAMFSMVTRPQMAAEADLKIDPNLLKQMEKGNGMYKAIVKVAWNPDLEPIKFNHDAVISELKAEAKKTQEPVINYLMQKRNVQILNTFWLDNLILIEARPDIFIDLASLSTVEKILMDFNVTVPSGETMQINVTNSDPATWNIEMVRAPEVWAQLGIYGEGIKFATEDTGIDLTHPDLAGTLYTADPSDPTYPGGWSEFDSNGNWVSGSVPHDTYGHGTATYGLIVGDAKSSLGAVGMAPKATGMHTLTLPGGGGYWPQVIAGLQWILDPVDAYGNHYPMPRVSSHSWGDTSGGYQQQLVDPVEKLYYAGHTVIAAIGNEGEGTHRTPGDIYEVIGCGATDSSDNVWSGSSGTTIYKSGWSSPQANWPDQWIKPDVSAPGLNVIVPYPGNQYVYWSGTSFSSPHVGGAAVLMLSADPSLNPDQIKSTLESTAGKWGSSRPDDRYGWGRIDAFEAVSQVALKQGIVGTVTDATTGLPLSGAKVTAGGRTVTTDANGKYKLRLKPGTYDVTFTRWGYYDKTVTGVVVNADQFTTLDAALTPVPPGYVAGKVYFSPTMIGIPGALVEAVGTPVPVQAQTDVDGYYKIAIPPGTYDFKASAFGFSAQSVTGVVVVEGGTTTVDFDLEQPPAVAVVGDYNNMITAFLSGKGYAVTSYNTMAAVIPDIPKYQTIVVNWPGYWEYVYQNVFNDFISATDTYGVGVVWLDQSYSYYQTGGWLLNQYLYTPDGYTWPYYRYDYNYAYGADYTYYRVYPGMDCDILPGWDYYDKIVHSTTSTYKMYLWYYDFRPDGYIPGVGTVKSVATVGYYYYGDNDYISDSYYKGIMKVTRDTGNKWVVLPLHGNNYYEGVSYWTEDTKTVFLNSLAWTAAVSAPHAKFVCWDLTVTPTVGLWYTDRTVSVGVKNVGWISGTTTVQIFINNVFEAQTAVTLAPGYSSYLTWTVKRFDVGTYTVLACKHLTATFVVRAPIKTVQAYEYNSNTPLAGADVYGYYRTYTGPGWSTQWSHTYGGYGHSQFAQPVGDLDGDGINEVIVGGYELYITPGYCRILNYDPTTGTYVEKYSWNEAGGSPSGATMLDLDGDGKLELVVSWAYSSNDGVYAYKWDGKKLTKLDNWYGSFVFDVYAGDYDDDGVKEVLVANAPWGVTYAHVIALGWDKTTNKFVEETRFLHPSYPYDECMMLWTGDTNKDGKTEIIISIAYSGSYNDGTWALNYDPATKTWTYTLVYSALINGGTHYGVVVGDVDGDGTPEIGIGNNNPSYVGAGAVLVEWDGSAYKKVWEGAWSSEYSIIEGVAIGDADNDGKNEFLAGGGNIHIIGWTGSAYVEKAMITETKGMLSGVVIGDMDNDGKNEVKACDIIGYGPGNEWIFKYSSVPTPGLTWNFKKFGTTDTNGQLAFNSPSSVVDMYLFIYKDPSSSTLCRPPPKLAVYQYLLTKYDYIADDMSDTYKPSSKTEAQVVAKPNAYGLERFPHTGIVWIQKQASFGPLKSTWLPILWPFTCNKTTPTDIAITPETYIFRHMLNEIDPFGSWWYYFMAPDQKATLTAGKTYSYMFAGPIQGYVKHTQTGTSVKIDWDANDNYGHQITGISVEEVSWLSSGTTSYIPVPITPSMLNDVIVLVGQTTSYYPLIALYDKRGTLVTSGYVTWDQKPAYATVPTGVTVCYAELDFVSGPYGNPNIRMYVTVICERRW